MEWRLGRKGEHGGRPKKMDLRHSLPDSGIAAEAPIRTVKNYRKREERLEGKEGGTSTG